MRRSLPAPGAGSFVLLALALLAPACGRSSSLPPAATMRCPDPIGVVPKEDCAVIASDFGQLDVGGAASHVGAGSDAEQKRDALQAVTSLARTIKEQRVKLCEEYVKCRVPLEEHDTQDKLLASSMNALFDLWNKRRFSRADEVLRFRESVRALEQHVRGDGASVQLQPPRILTADAALARVMHPEVAFRAAGTSLTVSATGDGERDALASKPESFTLTPGRRYRVNVSGSYAPAVPPTIRSGDEVTVRLRLLAERAGAVTVALRSLEDPEASETSETFQVAAGERSAKELKFTADPRQTGFSVGLGITAPVEIEALEVLRGGQVILTARPNDPATRTACAVKAPKQTLACTPPERAADVLALGQPSGYLRVLVKDSTGKRATMRTQSLEGGRSLDAAVSEDAALVVTLVGAGSATIDQVEIDDLGM